MSNDKRFIKVYFKGAMEGQTGKTFTILNIL